MASDQASDSEVQVYRTASTSLQLADVSFGGASASLLCDISTGQPCPVVPESWRLLFFDVITAASSSKVHVAQAPERRLRLGQHVCGIPPPGPMKVHSHVKAPLETFEVPEKRSTMST
ncbi:hypothetical protein AAFF_G00399080 [Aldrovandia affinis]|uniref:Uncharacterized protein n=1 Tax=Aldrovandia affinis TaxID=143900 RepID=A0AAD7WL95_9TELE|nr:hypothetical protein AAFF_G00399080 [Aldrovandia affinis]